MDFYFIERNISFCFSNFAGGNDLTKLGLMNLEILFEDDHLLAISKPPGILVHRTPMSEDKVFLLQLLRDQVGYNLYTIHRLDRGTSGVILFGKSAESAIMIQKLFMDHQILKKYLAIVRGWVPDEDTIDYPLSDPETGKMKAVHAVTAYTCLSRSEINEAIGIKYNTARFSFVEVIPETGRRHQIRKHFAHIFHPIIGDKRHGDVKHNNHFRKIHDMAQMMLHASELSFTHPASGLQLTIHDAPNEEFNRTLELLRLSNY